MKKTAVIIVAAGRGSRAGGDLPKQYQMIAGKTLLRLTIDSLQLCDRSALIQVVIHPDDVSLYEAATAGLTLSQVAYGGATRQASVLEGLKAIADQAPDYVLIHDAARPFVGSGVYDGVITKLQEGHTAVVPALAITDTLKRVESGKILHTVDRDNLYSVQTPQGFHFAALLEAHEAHSQQEFTDDAAVMEAFGHSVAISAGDAENFKVTLNDDFKKAEANIMASTADVRVGSGYDVHRFEVGESLWLCGVQIPYSKGLKGHSDADVGLHALTDALLASIAAGDIGSHFPPSDAKWRGAASSVFLKYAASIIGEKGGVISHVTVCLICEQPKIGPHVVTMRHKIADLLQISSERVSVQATTTEKLGFTGREEGIAAQATATVRLPF